MLSSQEAWAVGGTFVQQYTTNQSRQINLAVPGNGLILHYTVNSGWQPDNVEGSVRAPLLGISMDSSRDGWAVGYDGTFVHYDGSAWSMGPGPANFNKNVVGVAMLSPTNGWAVGYGGSILHYDGLQWSLVQSPTTFDLRSVAMSSNQEGWAVGDNGTIVYFNNGIWRTVASPTSNVLNDVSMLSANEGWAVGDNGTILHYRDRVWESVYDPYQTVDLLGVGMSSIHTGWILGDQHLLTYQGELWTSVKPAYISYASKSKYGSLPSDPALYSIVLSPANDGWAVGRVGGGSSRTVFILRYQSGTWSVAPIVGQ
jgi:photosystem II stability/assembly factor-like uncharacterized protein